MASVQEQLKLKRAPSDIWSVREQLCLATSVLKSGDQNWMSVSRSLKSTLGEDSSRPTDWFSQKSCAQQYDYLLENTDIPKRQKRESGETTSELIKRRLTEDRIAELTKILAAQKEEYLKLKSEVETLRLEKESNEKYKKLWLDIQEEEKQKALAKEEAAKNYQLKREQALKNASSPVTTRVQVVSSSPQLVATKLASPKTPVSKPDNTVAVENRPSSSAPTLSMLLQQPSVSSEKILQKLDTSPLKNLPGCSKVQTSPKTKLAKVTQDSEVTPAEEPAAQSSSLDTSISSENAQEVNKDAAIESVEIVEENVSDSKLENLLCRADSKESTKQPSSMNVSFDHSDERIYDSSTSAGGDISIEEIDSSSSKIAEIIGTSIEIIQPEEEQGKTSFEEIEQIDEPMIDSVEDKSNESLILKEPSSAAEVDEILGCKMQTETSSKQSSDEPVEDIMDKDLETSLLDTTVEDESMDYCESTTEDTKEKSIEEYNFENLKEKRKSVSESISEKSSKDTEIKSETAENDETVEKTVSAVSSSNNEDSNVEKVENVTPEPDIQKVNDKCIDKEALPGNSSPSELCKKPIADIENVETVIKIEKEDDKTFEDNTAKMESEKCDSEKDKKECQKEEIKIKEEIKTDEVVVKQENIEVDENSVQLDKEELPMVKFSGGQVVKTYSKKQNARLDTELENDSGEETADYRAWKKSVMMVYNRLATHKYGSTFLRPITEDQAPGYHSIVLKPMDLSKIKKNIDNGSIRSTSHFQREIMLMFQNAIMFNKQQTLFYKQAIEMQEDFLQQLEVLQRASVESSFRRETRREAAASSSSESMDTSMKRRWSHNTPNLQTSETTRLKKLRKSRIDS